MTRASLALLVIGACLFHAPRAFCDPPLDTEGPKYGVGCARAPGAETPAVVCNRCCSAIKDNFTLERTFDLAGCNQGCLEKSATLRPPLDTEGPKYGAGCARAPGAEPAGVVCDRCCTAIKDNFTFERIFDLAGCKRGCREKSAALRPPLDTEGPKYGAGCAGAPGDEGPAVVCDRCCTKIRDNFTLSRIFDLAGCKKGCREKWGARLSAGSGPDCPLAPAFPEVKKDICAVHQYVAGERGAADCP